MSIAVSIEVSERLHGYLAAMRELGGSTAVLNRYIAGRAQAVTRDWLIEQAKTRHKTADALGAKPTDHLVDAAKTVTGKADDDGVTIGITSPGIGRAFHPLDIKPGNGKKYLTIPATAKAYGRRAGSFNDLRIAFFRKAGQLLLALVKAEGGKRSKDERPPIYYWLKKQVTVPQDRTLLPGDEDYFGAAKDGVFDYLRKLRADKGL